MGVLVYIKIKICTIYNLLHFHCGFKIQKFHSVSGGEGRHNNAFIHMRANAERKTQACCKHTHTHMRTQSGTLVGGRIPFETCGAEKTWFASAHARGRVRTLRLLRCLNVNFGLFPIRRLSHTQTKTRLSLLIFTLR